MPDRSRLSRVLCTLGRLLRRFTIGVGALILLLYFFGDWFFSNWPYPACSEWPKSSLANARGDVAEIGVHGCILGLVNRQYLLRVRSVGGLPAKLVVRFKPSEWPALHLARRRSLAGRSRRGQVPIAADRSSWTDPCHFHL
jgi:hypothetical protein